MYGDQSDLFTLSHFVIDGFFNGFGNGAHGHNDVFRIRGAIIGKRVIFATTDFGDLLHIIFYQVREGLIEWVYRFPCLEVDIGVLGRSARDRVFRIHCPLAEFLQGTHVDKLGQFLLVSGFHLLYLMRSTESVKEMQEGQSGLNGSKVCNGPEIHDLLGTSGSQKAKTGMAGTHYVRMVTKDRQGLGCQTTC